MYSWLPVSTTDVVRVVALFYVFLRGLFSGLSTVLSPSNDETSTSKFKDCMHGTSYNLRGFHLLK